MSFKKGDKVLCLSPGLWGPPYLLVGTIRPFGKMRGYLKYGPAVYEENGPFPLSEFIPYTPEAEAELMSLLGEVKAAFASYETLRQQIDALWTSLSQEGAAAAFTSSQQRRPLGRSEMKAKLESHAYVGKGKRVHLVWSPDSYGTLCGLGPYDRLTDEPVDCRNCLRFQAAERLRQAGRLEVRTNFAREEG